MHTPSTRQSPAISQLLPTCWAWSLALAPSLLLALPGWAQAKPPALTLRPLQAGATASKPAPGRISLEALMAEIQALRARVSQLEAQAQANSQARPPSAQPFEAAAGAVSPNSPSPMPAPGHTSVSSARAEAPISGSGTTGMTSDQQQEFNRIAVKTEAIEDAVLAQGLRQLKVSGLIDPVYVYNQAGRTASFQLLNREPYAYDNSYFGMAVLDIQKETEDAVRLRLTLAPERGAGSVVNGSLLHEASINLPLSDLQTRLWAGQFPDWTGYEMTLPHQNKLISHNLLFDFTAPTTYTGVVADVTRRKWMFKAGLANVNAPKLRASASGAGNRQPALIYRVDYAKGEFQGFGFSGLHGRLYNAAADATLPDGSTLFPLDGGRHTLANLLEFDAYFIRGPLTVQGQLSWGQHAKAAIHHEDGVLRDARWWGASALLAYRFTPRWESVVRGDYLNNTHHGGGLLGYSFDDAHNGIGRGWVQGEGGAWLIDPSRPSQGSRRYALALGSHYLLNLNTSLKAEVRLDGSDRSVFYRVGQGRFVKNNLMLATGLVVQF
jgi:hypothetical protein